MILSRVFSLSLGVFLLVSTLAYVFIDFRPTREQAYDSLQRQRFFTVLDIYSGERFLEEEDYAILSLALDGITKEINKKSSSESKIGSAESLRRRYSIDFLNRGAPNEVCIHLVDSYFPYLKKHGYWYHRSLLAKSDATYFCNTPQVNSELLNRILLEDPNQMLEETSHAIRNLLDSNLDSIGELEMGFFLEVMHYLVQKEQSVFYGNLFRLVGDNVNFRTGPGIENPAIGRLGLGMEIFCFDEDSNQESIGGKQGNWKKCFSPDLFRSGWIFSGQIQYASPSQEIISKGRKRFSNLEFYTLVDFDNWNERLIPNHFHGNYIKTERVSKRGELGFRLFRPLSGKVELICRKFSGRKNYLEVFYEVESTDLPIPIAELHLVQGGLVFPAFRISADRDSILLNGERFVIDRPATRETMALKISSGSGGYVRGTLIHKNKGVIENLNSYPIDEKILKNSGYSWEICIPQAVERSKETALLYGFRIGREE